jgi:hypothetical protein
MQITRRFTSRRYRTATSLARVRGPLLTASELEVRPRSRLDDRRGHELERSRARRLQHPAAARLGQPLRWLHRPHRPHLHRSSSSPQQGRVAPEPVCRPTGGATGEGARAGCHGLILLILDSCSLLVCSCICVPCAKILRSFGGGFDADLSLRARIYFMSNHVPLPLRRRSHP